MTGATGAGTPGATGATGATGVTYAVGWEMRSATSASNSTNKSVTVDCTGSKVVTGGGATTNDAAEINLSNNPVDSNTWSASGSESILGSANNWTVTVWAICVNNAP